MKEFKIRLKELEDVKRFVNIVNQHDNNIDLISGQYIVDAKSILGILSLDLSRDINACMHNEEDNKLLDEIDEFIVK